MQAVETALPNMWIIAPTPATSVACPMPRSARNSLSRNSSPRLLPDGCSIKQASIFTSMHAMPKRKPSTNTACASRNRSLGPDHPDVAFPLTSLAILYTEQGKYAEAEPLYQRALRIWEQALGPDHPQCGLSAERAGESLQRAGQVCRGRTVIPTRLAASGNRRWDPTIPSHEKSCGTMQCCCARWGEKLKRASWKRAFLLPERCTSDCHPDLAIVILSVSEESRCPAREILRETQDDNSGRWMTNED